MLIFNPYDLEHVAMMREWLADEQKGIVKACPFYNSAQMKSMSVKKKKKTLKLKGILKSNK